MQNLGPMRELNLLQPSAKERNRRLNLSFYRNPGHWVRSKFHNNEHNFHSVRQNVHINAQKLQLLKSLGQQI